jgi:hypothetical protein
MEKKENKHGKYFSNHVFLRSAAKSHSIVYCHIVAVARCNTLHIVYIPTSMTTPMEYYIVFYVKL